MEKKGGKNRRERTDGESTRQAEPERERMNSSVVGYTHIYTHSERDAHGMR